MKAFTRRLSTGSDNAATVRHPLRCALASAVATALVVAGLGGVATSAQAAEPLSAYFPDANLRAVVATELGCDTCTSVTLEDLARVSSLNAANKSIVSISGIRYLTGLKALVLSNNQISELPIGEFDNLTSLTGVLLGNNQLSYLRAGVFDKLTQLEELELPRNNLLTLPSGVFSKLTALRALDISHNGLFDLSGLGISPTLRGQSEWNAFLQDVTRTLTVSSLPTTPTQLAQVISSNGWSIFKDSNGTELGVASKFVHVGNGVWKESTQPVFQSADRKFDAYSYKLSFSVSGTVTPAPKVITSAAVAATTTWTGSALKPAVSVKAGSTTLKLNTHYTVSYSANTAIGTAKVTVRGKGGYSGTKTVSFKILPKNTKVKSVTVGKRKITVKWSKVSAKQKISSYRISYRVKGTAAWKTKTVKASKSSLVIKGLKKKAKYQVTITAVKGSLKSKASAAKASKAVK